ncbi:hypothetical protein BLNAU_3573 [Blattamonas nauphoetae]|uniref:SH3 domain-containing protein n=1 Tax=Blattamonas nauphoetae TaxID=2049346 RepID=A0ABQ9YCE9_9EUKA|nr:hypothetical protein BLNAU_3573 [Blattamonas nauphoetae]
MISSNSQTKLDEENLLRAFVDMIDFFGLQPRVFLQPPDENEEDDYFDEYRIDHIPQSATEQTIQRFCNNYGKTESITFSDTPGTNGEFKQAIVSVQLDISHDDFIAAGQLAIIKKSEIFIIEHQRHSKNMYPSSAPVFLISNIPYRMKRETLQDIFDKYGNVLWISLSPKIHRSSPRTSYFSIELTDDIPNFLQNILELTVDDNHFDIEQYHPDPPSIPSDPPPSLPPGLVETAGDSISSAQSYSLSTTSSSHHISNHPTNHVGPNSPPLARPPSLPPPIRSNNSQSHSSVQPDHIHKDRHRNETQIEQTYQHSQNQYTHSPAMHQSNGSLDSASETDIDFENLKESLKSELTQEVNTRLKSIEEETQKRVETLQKTLLDRITLMSQATSAAPLPPPGDLSSHNTTSVKQGKIVHSVDRRVLDQILVVEEGTEVDILSEIPESRWMIVKNKSTGAIGYVPSDYINTLPQTG